MRASSPWSPATWWSPPALRPTATLKASGACSRCASSKNYCALGARRGASCPDPPHFDVLAFHPLSVGDPDSRPRPRSMYRSPMPPRSQACSAGRTPRHRAAGWCKARLGDRAQLGKRAPVAAGVPGRLQAQWISRALHRLWIAGVSLVAWQFLVDPYPGVRAATPTGGTVEYQRPAGLYSAGLGWQPRKCTAQAVSTWLQLPVRPAARDRRQLRVWALLMHPRHCTVGASRRRRWEAAGVGAGGRSRVCMPTVTACSTSLSRCVAPRVCACKAVGSARQCRRCPEARSRL